MMPSRVLAGAMDALRAAGSRRLAGVGAVDIVNGLMLAGGSEARLAPLWLSASSRQP